MWDRTICAARAAWYGAVEPIKLRLLRFHRVRDDVPYGVHWHDPLVSVLIPTHNRTDLLLSRALPSVLAQTYTNLHIVMGEHGCTDNTNYRAASFLRQNGWSEKRMWFVRLPRRQTYPPTAENHWLVGPVAPLNAMLRDGVFGAWIARIDDDDTWTPDHVETLLRAAQAGDYEFISSAYERERDGVREMVSHDGGDPPIGGTQTWLYRSYLKFMRYNPDCWRKSWNRVNDTDLADRFRKAGVRIGWIPDVTAHVLPRPGETTVGLAAYRRDAQGKERAFAF